MAFEDTLSDELDPDVPHEAAPFLFVAFESTRPSAGSARHALAAVDEITIGRGEPLVQRSADGASRLRLQFPDSRLSADHATIIRRRDQFELRDLDSKNGCHVNGAPQRNVVLHDGDLIQLGGVFFTFRVLPVEPRDLDLREDGRGQPSGLATVEPALEQQFARLRQVAASTLPVAVTGETGTGKELIARATHELSGRKGAFVPINCGALPASLLEAELFGYRRGAFSGANEDRIGLLRFSDGGTLFLDEIAELSPAGQTALLRALQEREVRAIGDVRATPVDLRVVCASHRGLEEAVEAGKFRADLFARLCGFVVRLPPLRARREDLGLLMATLLPRLAGERANRVRFAATAARRLLTDPWPLNVRALEKCLAAALIVAGETIDPVHLTVSSVLSADSSRATSSGAPRELVAATPNARPLSDEDVQRRDELKRLLEVHRGNISAIARELGKERGQVRRWLRRFNLS